MFEFFFYVLFCAFTLLVLFKRFEFDEEEPPDGVQYLYYYRPDLCFEDWRLWTWNPVDNSGGKSHAPESIVGNRALFAFKRSEVEDLGFLFFKGNFEAKDGGDRILKKGSPSIIYCQYGHEEIGLKPPEIKPELSRAFLDSRRLIQVQFSNPLQDDTLLKKLKVFDQKGKSVPIEELKITNHGFDVDLVLKDRLSLENKSLPLFQVGFKDRKVKLSIRGVLYDPQYSYQEVMGMSFSKDSVIFRLFAPLAMKVELLLFTHENEENPVHTEEMQEKRTGLFEFRLKKTADYMGWFYKYRVHGNDLGEVRVREVMDPYSKCHNHRFGRSLIFQDETPIAPAPKISREDLVIYELHLRDIAVHPNSGIRNRGKYLSLTEKNTHMPDSKVKTGLSHLKELGVNTIQILPVTNFDEDDDSESYNWGYMPLHFFCPHGGYASKTKDETRVRELKQMVSSLHEEGFLVVFDMVFNHTAEGTGAAVNFRAAAPGYYYRRNHDGYFFNGSGCGNEFKSEAPMGRKFILDCLKYYVTEYKVDGFRFDLMGLMDHQTMKEIEGELKLIKEDIILYGEPWAGGHAGIPVFHKGSQRSSSVSVFNDHFRDALRGDNSSEGLGFVQDGRDGWKVFQGVAGSIHDFADHPLESINYVACHDNYTLRDKLILSSRNLNLEHPLETVREMEKICAVLLMTAQGIPFLQNGQEFGRSKNFDHNSYCSSDEVNRVDWHLKEEEKELFEFHKKIITLRKQHRIFKRTTREQVENSMSLLPESWTLEFPAEALGYRLFRGDMLDSFEEVVVVVNPGTSTGHLLLPESSFCSVLQNGKFHMKISSLKPLKSNRVKIPAYGQLILARLHQKD